MGITPLIHLSLNMPKLIVFLKGSCLNQDLQLPQKKEDLTKFPKLFREEDSRSFPDNFLNQVAQRDGDLQLPNGEGLAKFP